MKRSTASHAFRSIVVLSILLCFAGGARAAGLMVPGCTDDPALQSVAPQSFSQGQMNAAITLIGRDLDKPTVSLDFGAGVQVLGLPAVQSTINDRLKIYKATISVQPTAAPGSHLINIRYCGGAKFMNTRSTIAIAASQQCTDNPAVGAVVPQSLTQGQMNATLTMRGQDLDKPGVTLDFGTGIQVIGIPLKTGASYNVTVMVLPSAPIGLHPISVRYCNGSKTLQTGAGIVITPMRTGAGQPPIPAIQPVQPVQPQLQPGLIALSPNVLEPGKTYQLVLTGVNLLPGMEVQLGEGITNKGQLTVLGPTLAKLEVAVSPAARGTRKAQLRSLSTDPWKETSATALIKAVEAVAPPKRTVAVKLPQFRPDLSPKGQIILDEPAWHQQTGSTVPPKGPDGKPLGQPSPIWTQLHPVLNDALVFDWHERHFGVAEWFEIRFFRKGALIAKRKIDEGTNWLGKTILPSYFRPDGALVAELLKAVPPKAGAKGTYQVSTGAVQGQASSPEAAASAADLAWEVAGYRRYASNGVATTALHELQDTYAAATGQQGMTTDAASGMLPVTFKDTEVEISERWPLFAPDLPTGLACGTGGGKGFQLKNIDRKDIGTTENYPYDRWTLTGSFSLANSPYAAHVSTSQTSTPDTSGHISTPFGGNLSYGTESQVLFTAWSFENVFIDWGDGTVAPLYLLMGGDAGTFNPGQPIDLAKSIAAYEHAYTEPGTYNVRIYQLSTDDVQKPQASGASYLFDAKSGGSGGLYAQAVALGGGDMSESYAVSKAVADRAYMLLCQQVTISPRHDPLAEGPLRLVDIAVQGFPGYAAELPPAGKTSTGAKPPATRAKGALKAGSAAASAALKQAEPSAALAAFSSLSGSDVFTSCDVSLTAGAQLRYYGKGKARVRWFLDNVVLGDGDILPLGPSPSRSQDALAGKTGGNIYQKMFAAMPILGVEAPIPSPVIAVGAPGAHAVKVEAEVLYDAKSPDLKDALTQALLGKDTALAVGLANGLKNGPKLGVLSPIKTSLPGWKTAQYLNSALAQNAALGSGTQLAAAGSPYSGAAVSATDAVSAISVGLSPKKSPPDYVVSDPRPYTVKKPAEGPCTFTFPVKDGSFLVSGLQDAATGKFNVTHTGDLYSGKGTLRIKLPTPSGSVAEWPVPVTFKDWQINADGFTVDKGAFEISVPGLPELPVPALKAKLMKLTGTAKDRVDAAFTFRLSNSGLAAAKAGSGQVSWPLPVSAALSPSGDWYAPGQAMPEIMVYDTGFRFTPGSATIDLSAAEGDAHSNCQGAGAGFMGVRMPGSTLTAFDFDLPGASTASVDTWGIDAAGICGFAKTGPLQASYYKGAMSWDSVSAAAANGDFTATYDNLRVKVPWLNVELKGSQNPVLKAGSGKVQMKLTGSDAQVQNGPVTFTATNLSLESYPLGSQSGNIPAVHTDSKFTFSGGDKPFAKDVWVNDLFFGLDGKAYLKGSASLGSKAGVIGKAPISLTAVNASTPASGSSRLRFDFTGDLTLSTSGSLVGQAPVSYGVDEPSAGKYVGYGPQLGTVKYTTEFPKTTKAAKAVITVKSVDLSGATSTASGARPVQLAYNAETGTALDVSSFASAYPPFITVAAADPQKIVFKGSVDLGMFPGMSSVLPGSGTPSGGFVLGYIGDEDFWSAKVNYSLPGSGIAIVPEIVHLRGLNGGLGYNVTKESLQHPDLEHAVGSSGNGLMLNVGMTVSSGDAFLYTLHGSMTIPKSAGDFTPQLDFRGWIFTNNPSTTSLEDVTGFVTYSSGLHGEIWSPQPKKIFGDYVWVNVPKGSTAVHFGTDDWYIHVGTETNKIKGHLFVVDANAYLMLGLKDGLKVGGGGSYYKSIGTCDDGFCVYIDGSISVDGSITPSPLHLSASASASGDVGGCYDGHCVGIGGDAAATAGIWPPDLAFGVTLDLPCPLPDVTGGIRLLEVPGLWGPSLDSCIDVSDLNPVNWF